jgi:CubicO group peptidase (beta-lactamase class C family)
MSLAIWFGQKLPLRPAFWMALLVTALVLLPHHVHAEDPRAAGGMLVWPPDDMTRALGVFVPDRMKALGVPGVALAIVSNGEIIYSGTFGRAETRGKVPVTPSTLFKAGELGETVAAFGALRMVDDKLLFLDAPLSRDLEQPWLSGADDNAKVTLREVLTHRSGLGDNVAHPARRTRFEPGSRFGHSGVGFLYLQYVMETVSGMPFDALMNARVFKPFGMTDSSYLPVKEDANHLAQGYVPLRFLLTLFYVPFVIAFAIIFVLLWGISRFLLQRRLEPLDYVWPTLGASGFAMAVVWWGLGSATGIFVIAIAVLSAVVFGLLASFAYYLLYIVGLARSRDGIISRGRSGREGLVMVFAGLMALGVFMPALGWQIPVLRLSMFEGAPVANVARSFRTTAQDMARFMIDVMDSRDVTPAFTNRMFDERVEVRGPFAWSLISGVRRDGPAETFWTRGSVMGFESLMVMDRKRKAGVVVLTNSRSGGELAQDVARNVLGVEAVWSLP